MGKEEKILVDGEVIEARTIERPHLPAWIAERLKLQNQRLSADGRRVLQHRVVPANDGGLSLGQAVVAGFARRGGG